MSAHAVLAENFTFSVDDDDDEMEELRKGLNKSADATNPSAAGTSEPASANMQQPDQRNAPSSGNSGQGGGND